MKIMLRFALLLIYVTAVGRAHGQLVSTGPNGGAVYSFYKDNARIFAAGSGGVYVSSDDGLSWQGASGSPTAFGCDGIYSVAASGGEIYAGSQQTGIYRSNDGGATWQVSTTGLRLGPGSAYADLELNGPFLLAVRPDSGFLYLSTNQGISWVSMSQMINNAYAQYISVNNGNFYISTPQGLYSSPNGLAYMMVDPSPADFGSVVWVNDTAYAATSTGIKRSADGGFSFTTVALPGRAVRRVAVSGNNMYAVVRGAAPVQDTVLYSTNGGASFSAAAFPASVRFSIVNDIITTSAGLLVATDYGMYATRNNGSTWVFADSGYHANAVRSMVVSGPYVFAGTSPMGIFRVMPDSGALQWQHTGSRAQNINGAINALAAKGAFIHAGGPDNYYRSADSGATWTAGTTGVSFGNITSIYASPATSDVWMIRSGNLYLSSNDGISFGQVVNSNLPLNQSVYVTKFDTSLFVVAGATLYKGNNSMSFSATSGITGRVTQMARTADSTIWAATDGFGLYSSKNGAAWTAVSAPAALSKVNALIADGDTLYAGTDNGIYTNLSGAWAAAGLQDHIVRSLAMRAGRLFVGTCSGAFSIPYKVIVPPQPSAVNGQHATQYGMDVFPNPAGGNFTVRVWAAAAGAGEVLLRNMLGATVLRQAVTLKSGINELPVLAKEAGLELPPGVYSIQVSGAILRATGRVVLR